MNIKPQAFLEDEIVIKEGTYGDTMYFMSSGAVEVLIWVNQVPTLKQLEAENKLKRDQWFKIHEKDYEWLRILQKEITLEK